MEKKLYRSSTDKKIAGVCGGLGEYLKLDSTILRVIWAVLCLCGGGGLLLYLVCALIIPENPENGVEL